MNAAAGLGALEQLALPSLVFSLTQPLRGQECSEILTTS